MSLEAKIDAARRASELVAITLHQTGIRWQASKQSEHGGGWRVVHGDTPGAALLALFDETPQPPIGVFD